MTVGKLYALQGYPLGTGIHIGGGKILVAYHLYAKNLANAEVKQLHYQLQFEHYPTNRVEDAMLARDNTRIEYRFCDPEWDYCVFEVIGEKHKTKMLNRHVYISTNRPLLDSEVITAGFPSVGVFNNPYASRGVVVDTEQPTEAAAEGELLPKRLLPSYPFTVSGNQGISNSPVSLKSDPLLMVAYFWAVPKDHRLEKDEAIHRYREGRARGRKLEDVEQLLNWGIGADRIANSLLHSPIKEDLCFHGRNDRIYVCR